MKVLLLLLLVSACSVDAQPTATAPAQPTATPQLLEQAYKKRSQAELAQFFTQWSTGIRPVSEAELRQMSARHRAAYEVFTAFYRPHQLSKLGGSEWGSNLYQKAAFLLVQNSVKIRVQDSPTRDSIMDFRPVLDVPGKQGIYLTPARATTLSAFLGNTHLPLGAGGIMNPARSSGESEKRKQFLENFIRIWYGHWGGYWQLESYPVAYIITFDEQLQTARVDFGVVYEGGEAILRKVDGVWKLQSARRTWIE